MKRLSLRLWGTLLLLLLNGISGGSAAFAAPATPPPAPVAPPAILGGTAVPEGAYPWVVSLKYVDGSTFCGGTVIAPQWVVTAAHCVTASGRPVSTASLRVTAGTVAPDALPLATTAQVRGVNAIVLHPDYDNVFLANDIALLWLSSPLVPTATVQPIALAPPALASTLLAPGTPAVAVGWGATKSDGTAYADALREVTLPIVSDAVCDLTSFAQPPLHLCAGGLAAQDICRGDSGSPLVVTDGSTPYMVGLVSATGGGSRCGDEGFPGMYTRIDTYTGWLASARQQTFVPMVLR